MEKKMNYKVNVFNRDWELSRAVVKGIREEAKRYRPSILTFFTHQSRSFLDQLLLPFNATALSYYRKMPIISFSKQ